MIINIQVFDTNVARSGILRVLLAALLMTIAYGANADCSKQDIDFYLSKDFTQEQITKLCTFAPTDAPVYQPYADPSRSSYDEDREERRDARRKKQETEDFLRTAISAVDVELTPESLKYTRKVCIVTGLDPDPANRLKVCPNVKYDITLHDLLILSSGKKFVYFGTATVDIKGKIKREIVGNLANYADYQRVELLETFNGSEPEGETTIPVRDDVPLERVVDTLRQLSAS